MKNITYIAKKKIKIVPESDGFPYQELLKT